MTRPINRNQPGPPAPSLPIPAGRDLTAPRRAPAKPSGKTERPATPSEERQRAARALTDAGTTPAERMAGDLRITKSAKLKGRFDVAPISIGFGDVLRQVKHAEIETRLAFQPGAELGPARVPDGTQLVARVGIEDGEVSRELTVGEFLGADGKQVALDAPFVWDPEKIYVTEDGIIRAEVPCFPDPDITAEVLGEDVKELPKDPSQLLQLLHDRGNIPVRADLVGGTDAGKDEPSVGALRGNEEFSPDSRFAQLFDTGKTEVRIEGELNATPAGTWASLGPNAKMRFLPGSTFRVTGPPHDLRMEITGNIAGAMFGAEDGTSFSAGAGRVQLEVRVRQEPGGGVSTELQVHRLEIEDAKVSSPTGDGRRNFLQLGRVSVQGIPGHTPIAQRNGELRVALDTELEDIRGQLHMVGARGEPASLNLGAEGKRSTGPMRVRGYLEIDSAKDRMVFASDLRDVHASLETRAGKGVYVVDDPGFKLNMNDMLLTGSGQLHFVKDAKGAEVSIKADEPLRARVELNDALFARELSGNGLTVDLAESSAGVVEIKELTFPPKRLDLSWQLGVFIEKMSVTLPSGESLNIEEGSRGLFTVDRLRYVQDGEGKAFPEVEGMLRIKLGAEAKLIPASVRGFADGQSRLHVDAKTGDTWLEFPFKMDAKGNFEGVASVHMQRVSLASELVRGKPNVGLPDEHLLVKARAYKSEIERANRAADDQPLPAFEKPVLAGPDGPTLPPIAINPARLLEQHLAGANLSFGTRLPALKAIPLSDGRLAKVSAATTASEVRVDIAGASGRIDPAGTRIELSPPLRLDVSVDFGKIDVPLWPSKRWRQDVGSKNSIEIEALEVQRDGDGRLRFLPKLRNVEGFVFNTADVFLSERDVGDALAAMIFGTASPTAALTVSAAEVPQTTAGLFTAAARQAGLDRPMVFGDGRASAAGDPLAGLPPELRSAAEVALRSSFVQLREGRLEPGKLDLGHGQQISVVSGRNVTVAGDSKRLLVTADVELGATRLGGKDAGLALAGGRASLRLEVRPGAPGEKPHVSVELTDLATKDLDLDVRGTDGRTRMRSSAVQGAKVQLTHAADGSSRFEVTIPEPTLDDVSWHGGNGSLVRLTKGRAKLVRLGPGIPPGLEAHEVRGTLSANVLIEPSGSRVHVPAVQVDGGSLQISAGGDITTKGTGLQLRDGRATITNVQIRPDAQSRAELAEDGGVFLDLARIDAKVPKGQLRIDAERGWQLLGPAGDRNAGIELRGRGRVGFHTPSPYLTVVSDGEAQFRSRASHIAIGGKQGYGVALRDTYFFGKARGELFVGPLDAAVSKLEMARGADLEVVLQSLVANGREPQPALQAVVAVNGNFGLPNDEPTTKALATGPRVQTDLSVSGSLRASFASDANGLHSKAEARIDQGRAGLTIQAPSTVARAGDQVLEQVRQKIAPSLTPRLLESFLPEP